jgi:hypothetical protein
MSHAHFTYVSRSRCSLESLEHRRLLAAVPQTVIDAGAVPVQWQGKTIYAEPGRWLV